jgi:hypothetical protein
MKKHARILSLLLLVLLLASLFGCVKKTAPEPAEPTGGLDGPVYTLEPAQTSALTPEPDEPESTPAPTAAPTEEPTEAPTEEPTDTPCPVSEDGEYWTKDEVALYIHLYGHLPKNYITKEQAEALGWPGGSLEPYAPGCSIGGGYFGNYEGLLPKKKGRKYTECDIDTRGRKRRGEKRIVFSNDGLIYYTDDHYESFTLLYGEE